MNRDRIITADADKVSGAEFARSVGLRIRTKDERLAEWQEKIERYADMIEAGGGWSIPPPCLDAARALVAGRQRARRAA